MTTPQLLLIGGSDDDAGWVHRALAPHNGTVRLERLHADENPRPLLTSMRFDAVLIDLFSSRLDAAGWVALLDEVGQRAPIVVVADARQEADVAAWLGTGASDWVFRPGLLGLSAVLARLQREAREEAAAEFRERQLREATAALIELTASPTFRSNDLNMMLGEVTRRCTKSLGADRCGVWTYSEDAKALELVELFDARTATHSHGTRLMREEHPVYFTTLSNTHVMAVTHAQTDSRTREFASYFQPEGIVSTIDVALRQRGELIGTLCIEHRGVPRRWTLAEEVFVSALADVVVLAFETTERRRVEAALEASERRFRDIFRYSSDNILLYRVALDGRVFCEDINPAVEQSTGYRRDDVVGREAAEVMPAAAAARLSERHQQAIRARVPISYEHELPLASGPRVYNTAVIPMLDETGRVQRLASVARDVTTLRTNERLARQLESQLAEAQKNEALSRLAKHVAHDVSALLSLIDSHTQRLNSGDAPKAILDATERGRRLVERIGSVARGAPVEKQPVEFARVVDDVVHELSPRAPAIVVERLTRAVRVVGDVSQLTNTVRSLVATGLQSMPEGGRLRVELKSETITFDFAASHPPLRAGTWAHLSVTDSGRGMDEATRRRIFEPFFSPTDADLGLATVQAVVSGHGGGVFVSSQLGVGTTFDVYLPAFDAADDKPGMGQHLMLVDDHPGMARVSAKLLETLGYQTSVFDDPREALEAFRQTPARYDAVLTDLSMPQMSGEDFTRSLREVRPDLPVIISSGLAGHLDKDALASLGVSAVLLKPWKLDEAVATLRRVVPSRAG